MIGIGLRTYSNTKVYYCLIEKSSNNSLNYIDVSFIRVPLALTLPEALNFIRNTILDILIQYKVTRAVIRISEYGGQFNPSVGRIYLEGVIQETLASSMVEKYLAGQISEITKIAAIEKTDFKLMANAEKEFEFRPPGKDWKNDFSLEERESIIACYTSLNL